MSRACTVCNHPNRAQIDRQLVSGLSIREITRESGCSKDALSRHRDRHLSRQLLKAHDMRQVLDAENLAGELNDLIARTKRILDGSEQDGQRAIALAAIKELRANLEFLVRLACSCAALSRHMWQLHRARFMTSECSTRCR